MVLLGRVVENSKTGSDDMLAWSFPLAGKGVFFVRLELQRRGPDNVSQLGQGLSRASG